MHTGSCAHAVKKWETGVVWSGGTFSCHLSQVQLVLMFCGFSCCFFILSSSILCCLVQSCFALSYTPFCPISVPSYIIFPILPCPEQSCFDLSYPTLFVLSYLVLSFSILSFPILSFSYPILCCTFLTYPVLSYSGPNILYSDLQILSRSL